MISPALKTDRREVEAVITDCTGKSCAVVLSSELLTSTHKGTGGFASAHLGKIPEVQAAIQAREDRQVGELPPWLWIVNDLVFSSAYTRSDRQSFIDVCCHEASHHLTWDLTPIQIETNSYDIALTTEAINTEIEQWPWLKDAPCWHGHGHEFVRSVFHLAQRMGDRGFPVDWVSPGGVIPWGVYRYGCPIAFGSTMRREILRNAHRPIREVLATPAPRGLVRHWLQQVDPSLSVCVAKQKGSA